MELFTFRHEYIDMFFCVLAESEEIANKIFAKHAATWTVKSDLSKWCCAKASQVEEGVFVIVH